MTVEKRLTEMYLHQLKGRNLKNVSNYLYLESYVEEDIILAFPLFQRD
jgi:hypothetical protein